ncbi:MAG: Nramp family divalent metal transporter [Dyella sp.]|uniref:Nramp family divalent metal transporter n=1 Tax=Dyella sp. TaxID=1869338 RepID=UPI003F7EF314
MDVRRASAPLRALASRAAPWRADLGGATASRSRNWSARTWGAGALVAVGYMDPGNWATDFEAGSRFGYALVPVVILASLAGICLQAVAARLGALSGHDLARLCRDHMPRWTRVPMWLASEVAIVACDAAEVVGAALALHLLLGCSLWLGALASAFLLLPFAWLQHRGRAWLVAGVMVVMAAVVAMLGVQLGAAWPGGGAVLDGAAGQADELGNAGFLWLAAGIVGATIMPHNLYLHSALVTPVAAQAPQRRYGVLRSIMVESAAALTLAMGVNLGLLVLAGAVADGATGSGDELVRMWRRVNALLPGHLGGTLFALALLGCSLNGMVTTTMAGQVVMEGFLRVRMSLRSRALLTRGVAIVPAITGIVAYGGHSATPVLVASQVILGLQLPLAVLPMLWFAGDSRIVRGQRASTAARVLSWSVAALIVGLDGLLLVQAIAG